ncbi:class I SAM-dependent methyltransferase [Granulicatella seriolae]|uniref:class I SAM-dependent methyltransferase n=1 Tax=Granulicatella seriolae TaxID=2967226 RepID=UPI0038B2EC5C
MSGLSETSLVFKGFEQLWKAVQILQEEIGYSYVESLGENLQNLLNNQEAQQVDGQPSLETINKLDKLYQDLQIKDMSGDDIRRLVQYTFLKAAKEDGLQANHQMTPDAVALLVAFMADHLTKKGQQIFIGDFAVGSGNLLSTILLFLKQSHKNVAGVGIDNDEVLLHLATQAMYLENLEVSLVLQDSLTELLVKPLDLVVSDLPIGYYPVKSNAERFQTNSIDDDAYAHHLLIEQHINYLKEGGIAIFVVPSNLFDSPQAPALLDYLQKESFIQAMLGLPSNLFQSQNMAKSILIVQKKGNGAKQVSQVLLGEIPDLKNIKKTTKFTETFEKWSKEMV